MKMLCVALMMSFGGLVAGGAQAQVQVQQKVLAVSEGTSGRLDQTQVIAKYEGLADLMGQALHAKVSVVFVREFKQLEEGMRSGQFDFVMARPSDYPARGMRDYGYSFVASAKPDGQCLIIVPKDSPLKTVADIKGKRLVLPEQISYMSRLCTAELREQGISVDKERVQYVRDQAAVGFYLENNFSDVGAIASYFGGAKNLEKNGKRVLHQSMPQPYFPLIANKTLQPAQIKSIQAELVAMPQNNSGKAVLQRIGIERFDTGSETRMQELLKWLKL